MSSRKKPKRGKRKQRPRSPQRTPPLGPLGDKVLIMPSRGEEKMSEVLMDFLEPYAAHWSNEKQLKKLLSVGVIAWNAAILAGDQRQKFLQDMEKAVPSDILTEFRGIIAEMIRRKETYFAGNTRMIVSYDVEMRPSGRPYVSILSTPPGL